MQAPGIILASILSAAATSFGVVYVSRPVDLAESVPAGAGAAATDTVVRLERLETAISELRAAVEAVATRRVAVDPVSDRRVAAAVAKWMDANPPAGKVVEAVTGAGESGTRSAFQQLLEPGISDADVNRIWAKARENGQADELLKLFEDRAANFPTDVDVQVQVGVAYLQRLQGMPPSQETGLLAQQGDQAFDRALAIDPNNWDARYIKSMSLSFWPAAFGKQKEAIDNLTILRRQQETGPVKAGFAQTYVLLGNLYSQQGKADLAKEAWTAGLGLFPDNATLKKQLGQ